MSASGSASRSRMSANFPASRVPKSLSPSEARAPFFVADTIACAGVMPSSTSPSIADSVAVPGIRCATQLPPSLLAIHQLQRVVPKRVRARRVDPRLGVLIVLPWLSGDAVGEDGADHLPIDNELHQVGGNRHVVHFRMLNEVDAGEDGDAERLGVRRVRFGDQPTLMNFLN